MAAGMTTRLVHADQAGIEEAGALLAGGGIAAIPTETVYGLAACMRGPGVPEIFAAKGRPQDNPLIVHIADVSMLGQVVAAIPHAAMDLMDAFWPGPLSLILKKNPGVPDTVSAGLDTVAVRMPAHPVARAIIRAAGEPLAAPSANTSGRPSPTRAEHVLADLNGRIPLIVDGGPCDVGVESTVLDLSGGYPTILRPGDITAQQIRKVVPEIRIRRAAADDDAVPASPGMKYRHYAPSAQVVVLDGKPAHVAREVRQRYDYDREVRRHPRILCADRRTDLFADLDCRSLGQGAADTEQRLFDELRRADIDGRDVIYFLYEDEMGTAVRNRILKAAAAAEGSERAE